MLPFMSYMNDLIGRLFLLDHFFTTLTIYIYWELPLKKSQILHRAYTKVYNIQDLQQCNTTDTYSCYYVLVIVCSQSLLCNIYISVHRFA